MRDPKKWPVTAEGKARAEAELQQMIEVDRPAIIAAVAEARSHGDLRENAAYHAARHDQVMLEKRIAEMEGMLKHAVIVEDDPNDQSVRIGTTVVVEIEGDEERYTIAGALEAKPAQGLISNESPVGNALLGKNVGDEAKVDTSHGFTVYKILRIER